MQSTSIGHILSQSRELKSLPESVYQLNQLMQQNSVTVSEVAEIVSADPVLSAKILKSVNSPFYGFPSRIDTIAYAVSILGMDSIRYLAISNAVISKFSGSANTLIPMDSFWRHSFAVGVIAQQLAKLRNYEHDERLFTSGLLHELGTLLLAIAIPEQYRQVITLANQGRHRLYEAEQELLGFTHVDITATLLQHWNLPDAITDSIRNIYSCEASLEYRVDCALLNIADAVASSTFPSIRLANMELSIQQSIWKNAGIQPPQLNSVLDELDSMVENAMKGMYFESAA